MQTLRRLRKQERSSDLRRMRCRNVFRYSPPNQGCIHILTGLHTPKKSKWFCTACKTIMAYSVDSSILGTPGGRSALRESLETSIKKSISLDQAGLLNGPTSQSLKRAGSFIISPSSKSTPYPGSRKMVISAPSKSAPNLGSRKIIISPSSKSTPQPGSRKVKLVEDVPVTEEEKLYVLVLIIGIWEAS